MMIDLRRGHPAPEDLPWEVMASACENMASRLRNRSTCLTYGSYRGETEALSKLLSKLYGDKGVDSKRLMVTNGGSHGLDIALSALVSPGDLVVTERPCYFLAAGVLRDRGLRLASVPVDSEGMRIDLLEKALRTQEKFRPKGVYCVPRHGNPSGATLSEPRRRRLVDLSIEFDFFIFADEVYELLDWSGLKTTRLSSHKVLSICSFSKILSPALRLGWIEAEDDLIDKICQKGYVRSGGGLAPFHSVVALEADLEKHLNILNQTYKLKSMAMCTALQRNKDVLTLLCEPKGGYFAWVKLPDGVSSERLAESQQQVLFLPGSKSDPNADDRCCEDDDDLDNYLRLCFAFETPEAIEKGVDLLASAIRDETS